MSIKKKGKILKYFKTLIRTRPHAAAVYPALLELFLPGAGDDYWRTIHLLQYRSRCLGVKSRYHRVWSMVEHVGLGAAEED